MFLGRVTVKMVEYQVHLATYTPLTVVSSDAEPNVVQSPTGETLQPATQPVGLSKMPVILWVAGVWDFSFRT